MIAKDFVDGFLAVFRGIYIILTSKRMMLLSVLPTIIGFCILVFGAWYLIPKYDFISEYWNSFFANQSRHALFYLGRLFATALVMFAILVAWIYVSFLATKLFAGPFYSLLAIRVLKDRGLKRAVPITFGQFLFMSFRTTAVNMVEIILFSLLGIILFVFSFVPFLNVLAGFGFFLVMAFDSADYTFDVFSFGLFERLKYFFSHFAQFCGFALAISLVILVPGLNLILFAASVAGAADLASRQNIQEFSRLPQSKTRGIS
jgi:uncharacterized protein involved in cysteine biosynthesis